MSKEAEVEAEVEKQLVAAVVFVVVPAVEASGKTFFQRFAMQFSCCHIVHCRRVWRSSGYWSGWCWGWGWGRS